MEGINTQNKTHTVQIREFMLDGSEGKKVGANLENFNSRNIYWLCVFSLVLGAGETQGVSSFSIHALWLAKESLSL